MPKLRKQVSTFFRSPKWPRLTEPNWRQIEQAYGHRIPVNLRERIEGTNDAYEVWVNIQESGAPLDEVKHYLTSIARASAGLRENIKALESPSASAAEAQAAVMLGGFLKKNLASTNLEPKAPSTAIGDMLSALEAASTKALNEADNWPTFRDGVPWENWVCWLSDVLSDAGLPVAVRKDGEISPFISFFRELQNCLPPNWRRHSHSDHALSKAISAARRRIRALKNAD